MDNTIEYFGRLPRSDKRPANPGHYDLEFKIHPGRNGSSDTWSEIHHDVEVVPGGFFSVLLGSVHPLDVKVFQRSPGWLSIHVIRSGQADPVEHGPRQPITGAPVVLGARLAAVEAALARLKGEDDSILTDRLGTRVNRLREYLDDVAERLRDIEDHDRSGHFERSINKLLERADRLEGEDGRLTRIEDELEDLVGPDGDVTDLNERMDHIEGKAPELIRSFRSRQSGPDPETIAALQARVDQVTQRLDAGANALSELLALVEVLRAAPAPTADSLGVVQRGGDVMTGGLTVNRGGIEVLSGGLKCRGATVTTIEASNLAKAAKVIAEAIELRGDLTVDNSRRALQIRMIEGRQGSARRDGALHLNTRGGAEVVVGNETRAAGLQVHGAVGADGAEVERRCVALSYPASGRPLEGEVVRLADDGQRAVRCTHEADPRCLGVVVSEPGLLLGGPAGSGRVTIGIQGIVECRASAEDRPIQVGDLLVSAPLPGRVCSAQDPAPGTVLGKALAPLATGCGTIPMWVLAR